MYSIRLNIFIHHIINVNINSYIMNIDFYNEYPHFRLCVGMVYINDVHVYINTRIDINIHVHACIIIQWIRFKND